MKITKAIINSDPIIQRAMATYVEWMNTFREHDDGGYTYYVLDFLDRSHVMYDSDPAPEKMRSIERHLLIRTFCDADEGGPQMLHVMAWNGEVRFISMTFDTSTHVVFDANAKEKQ